MGIMGQDYCDVFVVSNRLENYLVVQSLVNLFFELNSIEHFELHSVSLEYYPWRFLRVLR